MKKIGIVSIAAVMALLLTACGTGNVSPSSSHPSSKASATSSQAPAPVVSIPEKVSQGSVPDSFAGLKSYLGKNLSLQGDGKSMCSDIIGAGSGVRYIYGHNGKDNVTLELYEYNPANLNSTAQKVISEVKGKGHFSLLGQQVDATLSDSGKYLMIYKDTATDSSSKAYDAEVKKMFRKFKAD